MSRRTRYRGDRAKTKYVMLANGVIRRRNTMHLDNGFVPVLHPQHPLPATERPPLDLDHTRKHRDELRAARADERAAAQRDRAGESLVKQVQG